VNKIMLLDHAQDFTGDPLSAEALRGIDVIVAAGTTGFMAQPTADGPFNQLRDGDSPEANYPTIRLDSEGNRVLVINSDQLYRYVGQLIVGFDSVGRVNFVDERSGPIATTAAAVTDLETVVGPVDPPVEVEDAFAELQATPLIQDQFEVIGTTASELNGARADVRSRETNLGRLAADSTLWYANQAFPARVVDIALKNGGGIRDTILGPNITRLTIGAALAFDNKLSVLDLTGAELLAAMENAVSRYPALDGRFPQVAGMQIEFTDTVDGVQAQTSLTEPTRLVTLIVTRFDGTEVILVENGAVPDQAVLSEVFTMATNSFLLTGGDGYEAFAQASNPNTEETAIGEREILEDYIQLELGSAVDIDDPPPAPRVSVVNP
jgi:2',3'-cyclic-nucleotide 2'-phosphodiesterase (5'-nucleotidase family)